ncbi:hypothetical protein CsSME_00012719 [Camellia sinensis var. sinensis]
MATGRAGAGDHTPRPRSPMVTMSPSGDLSPSPPPSRIDLLRLHLLQECSKLREKEASMEKLQTMVAGSPLETMVVAGSPLEMTAIKEKWSVKLCKTSSCMNFPLDGRSSGILSKKGARSSATFVARAVPVSVMTLKTHIFHQSCHLTPEELLLEGIQEGAADWDENWDKFEDEGVFTVKELTLDVENVVAPLQLSVKHLPQKRKRHQVEGKGLPMMLIAKTA